MRFLWQRRGLLCLHRTTSLQTISSTSPCRLQPIYYSRVSATIRLCKILVHTPSLAPLPHIRGPGHIKDNTTPPWGPIYLLNETKLEELCNWPKKMTTMGAVRQSKSACSSPMLFVPKGHGRDLCLCIDYRAINKIAVPNRYPLPNMNKLKERVRGAKYFNKIDLKNGYYLIRIKEGDA